MEINIKRLLLQKDEMVLFKNSEAGKDSTIYGNLYNVISDYKSFSCEDLQKNKVLDSKARTVLLQKNVVR